ncbi:MAG: hypothetical protein ACJ74O_02770 [Frankiaceae bacterium]
MYVAGLVFVAQHVAERYSPLIYLKVVLRAGRMWLAGLSATVLASVVIAVHPPSDWTNTVEAALLLGGLVFALGGLFSVFRFASDRRQIVGVVLRLGEVGDRTIALQEMAWNAVNRGDIKMTHLLLDQPARAADEQAELLGWIVQYPVLLQQSWLRQLLVRCLLPERMEDSWAELTGGSLGRLLTTSLDAGWFDTGEDIVLSLHRSLDSAPTFGEHHSSLVFDVGFALHMVGEEGRASKRIAHPAVALASLQEWFEAKLTSLRRAVLRLRDTDSTTNLCQLLDRLAQSGIATLAVTSQVHPVLEESYRDGTLESDALEALAGAIGAAHLARFAEGDSDQLPDVEYHHLDALAGHVALYAAALGDLDQVPRMMGNARFIRADGMPRRLVMGNRLPEELYVAVARALGARRWPQ